MNHNIYSKTKYHPQDDPQYPYPITKEYLKEIFHDCSDLMFRTVTLPTNFPCAIDICWIDGLVGNIVLAEDVLRPLTNLQRVGTLTSVAQVYDHIVSGAVYAGCIYERTATDDLVSDMLAGHCALLFTNPDRAITFDVRSTNMRSISESTLEKTVKGAKEAFIESMKVNNTLMRRKLQTPKLKIEMTRIGRKSNTPVSVLYIEGVAKEEVIAQVNQQLSTIDIDGLITAGYLEQYIVSNPHSLFPQLLHTERPDTFASMLLEGRVGILVEGIPVGFAVPAPISRFMQVSEDTAQHFIVSSLLVLLRYTALVIAMLLPGIYVAISMYHQEMIPTQMLSSMIEAKQKVPFSTAVEVIGMLIAFELLQEAGLRLPNPVGDTVSIIGALIVGQAAVDARIVSPIAVIIVAFSSISSYTLPCQDLSGSIRVIRLLCVLAAMIGGIFGVAALTAILIWYLCTMETYGVSYMAPFVDDGWLGWMRSLIRRPLWQNKFRDKFASGFDNRRSK